MSFASGKSGKLTRKLSPSDTSLYLNADLGITSGRLYAKNDTQVEFLAFTGKTSISATEWQYTGLTRQLSTTAVPATSLGGGYTWLANQDFIHDQMHDQILDTINGGTVTGPVIFNGDTTFTKSLKVPVFADATARDVAIPSPENGMIVYNTALGTLQQYIGGAWASFATGTTVNADTTTAGKVEIATLAETTAGTNTGGTGAQLVSTPGDIKALYSGINHTHAIYAIVKNGALGIVGTSSSGTGTYTSSSTGILASPTILSILYGGTGQISGNIQKSSDNVNFTNLHAFASYDPGGYIPHTYSFLGSEGFSYRTTYSQSSSGSANSSITYTV